MYVYVCVCVVKHVLCCLLKLSGVRDIACRVLLSAGSVHTGVICCV